MKFNIQSICPFVVVALFLGQPLIARCQNGSSTNLETNRAYFGDFDRTLPNLNDPSLNRGNCGRGADSFFPARNRVQVLDGSSSPFGLSNQIWYKSNRGDFGPYPDEFSNPPKLFNEFAPRPSDSTVSKKEPHKEQSAKKEIVEPKVQDSKNSPGSGELPGASEPNLYPPSASNPDGGPKMQKNWNDWNIRLDAVIEREVSHACLAYEQSTYICTVVGAITKDGFFSDLKIDSPSESAGYDRAVFKAIKSLDGSAVLMFPANTMATSIPVRMTFLAGTRFPEFKIPKNFRIIR